MLLSDPLNYLGTIFDKQINKRNLINFFNQKAFSKKEESIVMELTKDRAELGSCGENDKSFCVVVLVSDQSYLNNVR